MARRYRVDEGLKKYATEKQAKYIDAVNEHGGIKAAARSCGVHHSVVSGCIQAVERAAALRGYSPEHDMRHEVPAPFVVKGISTLYDKDGGPVMQWVKSKIDEQQVELALRAFVADLVKDAKGLSRFIEPPKVNDADLMAVYPIGDPHFGMYAWKEEAGQDFDTDIAEKLTMGAVDRLVASAPPAEVGIVLPLGDVLHADDSKNRTPQSGNTLDVDTRHQRVMLIAKRALKRAIYRALEKHKKVLVRVVSGNHDPHASFAIAMALSEHFCNNPRVTVDLSPAAFWYYRFGKVLLGVTHGDKVKGKDLLGVMASDRPEEWGQTKFRYFYHGHLHERGTREMPGLMIEWFRTLAPSDAWAAGEGYRSGRNMCAIVMHKEFGEVERHTCDVTMLSVK